MIKYKLLARNLTILFTATFLLVLLILWGYEFEWTGFGPSKNSKGELIPEKSFWDWLGLLVVPAILLLIVYWLDISKKNSDKKNSLELHIQKTISEYLEFMTKLLLDNKLDLNTNNAKAVNAARARTLITLEILDGNRKAQLLQFLSESCLITINPIIDLNGANFRCSNLNGAVLVGVEIKGAFFNQSTITNANLTNSIFIGSDFTQSDFSETNLKNSDFTQAKLTKTNLSIKQKGEIIKEQIMW